MTAWTTARRQELCRKRREAAQKRRVAASPTSGGTVGGGDPPAAIAAPTPSTTPTEDNPMSVTSNRTDPDMIYDLPRAKVVRIIEDIETAKQRQADANTAHMGEWKAAKEAGAPVEALKMCLRLNRMSADKRNDILRGFDELRGKVYTHWDQQPDLFVADQPAADADADALPVEAVEADDDTATTDDTTAVAATGQQRGEGDAAAGNGSDWTLDGAAADADAALDQAGFIFTAGRNAGLEGKTAADNPHAEGTSSAAVWERGRASTAPVAAEVDNFNAGFVAHSDGKGKDANPHADGSTEAGQWEEGWDSAAKKAAKAKSKKAKADPAGAAVERTDAGFHPAGAAAGDADAGSGSNITVLPVVAARTNGPVQCDVYAVL